MQILLVDNGTTLLKKLQTLIPGHESIVHHTEFNPDQANQADLVVLSGSSTGPLMGNESQYRTEIDFICNSRKPLIGVCFGHELIVHAWGGKLQLIPTVVHGLFDIDIVAEKHLFGGKESITVYEHHRWTAFDIPDELEVLAKSVHGPEIVRHRERPTYGMQFHPENMVDETDGDEFFLNLFKSLV